MFHINFLIKNLRNIMIIILLSSILTIVMGVCPIKNDPEILNLWWLLISIKLCCAMVDAFRWCSPENKSINKTAEGMILQLS